MKRMMGTFIVLLFLFSACGTPIATEPVTTIQRTQTLSPVVTLTSSQRPTSTPDPLLQEGYGTRPFCQVAPDEAFLGSSVNISAFHLPANRPVSIFLYYETNGMVQLGPTTIMTDDNGYVNIDVVIPLGISTGLNRIALITERTRDEASCGIQTWTESSQATYSAWQATVRAPTMTPAPEQAAVTATQQALHEKFDKYCKYNPAWGFRFSPNGQWVEVSCSWDTIEFVHTDETKNWEASADTLINPGGDYFIGVDHWSNDGAYVYIDFDPHTDGYWEYFHQGIVLYRLDLETGQVSEVLPLVRSNWRFYSLAFSPNDKRLAYIVTDQSPVILNIRDMQTGEEQSFKHDPKYNTGGGFLWSPDSQKLVFSITQFDTNIYEDIGTSIVLWEKDKPATTMLIEDYQEILVPIEWIEETKLILQVLYKDEIRFEFDTISGELKQISS